jgi:predicted nucleotidyltransferase
VDLPRDFKDLLEAFGRAEVEYAIVGGYAVAFHGRVRATKDVDILLGGEPSNLERAAVALADFGAPTNVANAVRALGADEVAYFGQPPMRVDLLRTIDGVSTHEVIARAVTVTLDEIEMRVIALDDLILNKRAAGRPRDIEDANYLERIRSHAR